MSTTPDLTGKTIDKYYISAFIASGGMAAVYRARQNNLDREVAIKVLPTAMAEDPMYVARFLREAETAAKLEHPHIIPIHDYGTERGLNYVVMRLLTGGTLTERMKARQDTAQPLPSLHEIARLLRQLAGALDHAHSQKVIHRDVKPSNIMFDHNGTPFLVDFGIAKLMATTAESLTETGVPMGTPIYMSPEQWDSLPATPGIDQYALAVVIYRLVTGDAPFRADTPYGLMQKHLTSPVPPITNYSEPMAAKLHAVLSKALAKEANDRYPNCIAFADAFEAAVVGDTTPNTNFFTFALPQREWATPDLEDMLTEHKSEQVIATRPQNPTSRLGVVMLGVVVIALVVLGVFFVVSGGDENPDEDETPLGALDPDLNPVVTTAPTAAEEQTSIAAQNPDVTTAPTTAPTTAAANEDDTGTAATPSAATTVVEASPVAPTGDGVPITLDYGTSSTILIANRSTQTVDITGLRLQLPGGEQYFDGARIGATTSANFSPTRCVMIGLTADQPVLPASCSSNSPRPYTYNFGTADELYFVWDVQAPVFTVFEVWLNDVQLGTCDLNATTCTVLVPTDRVVLPTPTPRPVIGPTADEQNGLLLIYPNGTSLSIINTSSLTLDLTGVQLELPDGRDHYDAQWFGEQTRTTFTPGRCIFIWYRPANDPRPDFCSNAAQSGYDRMTQESYLFVWSAAANPAATFNFSRNDAVLATCSVGEGRCFIAADALAVE